MRLKNNSDDFWPSIADMMSGLMIIFMFIAISFMSKVSEEKKTIEKIAEEYQITKIKLYEDLINEFKGDLSSWNAVIDKDTLAFRFKEPDIFFKRGQAGLTYGFENILDDFFPRYVKILNKPEYKEEIEEIRIEGHTSSEWNVKTTELKSYFNNMALSQARTRSVLEYVMLLPKMSKYKEFLIKNLTANGLSYSQRIMVNGKEDKRMSRRVEFRIRTTSEKHIDEILKKSKDE